MNRLTDNLTTVNFQAFLYTSSDLISSTFQLPKTDWLTSQFVMSDWNVSGCTNSGVDVPPLTQDNQNRVHCFMNLCPIGIPRLKL